MIARWSNRDGRDHARGCAQGVLDRSPGRVSVIEEVCAQRPSHL